MDLPKKEITFEFDHNGVLTGRNYPGQFTVRCILNMAMRHQMELEKTRLTADYVNPSDGLAGIAIIVSKLRAHIVDGPEWWKESSGGFTLEDEDVLVALYDKVLEAEEKWRESLQKKGEKVKVVNEEKAEEKIPAVVVDPSQ